MDPDVVRRTLQLTASTAEIGGSNPPRLNFYDPFVINGVSPEAAEHGRVLCSFVVHPASPPAGYLRSGVTAKLAVQLGSAVFYSSGLASCRVSLEISLSFVDAAAVGLIVKEEIEIDMKLSSAGKSAGVVSVDFRKKRSGKLIA